MLALHHNSISENAEITVAMLLAKLDYFLFDRGWICFGLREHQAPRRRRVNTVGFNRKVMVVAHDEGHRLELLKRHRLADHM